MKIETDTYDFIEKKYDKAISWMNEIGVRISSGRTEHYRRVLDIWKTNYHVATNEAAKNIFTDFVSSVSEIYSFIQIYTAFKNEPVYKLSAIKSKLQKGVNGPINAEDERPKTSEARNYIFEALVSAKFHNPEKGLYSINSSSTDTAVQFKKTKILIECKRVSSEKNLENNIRKAANQLNNQLNKKIGKKINRGHKGLVALDFSKLLHSGDKILVKQNDLELLNYVSKITEAFIGQYSRHWDKIFANKNKRIVGTLVYFSTMATSEERNLLVTVSDWAINPKANLSQYNKHLLRNMVDILSKKKN